ncbi:hypothetical protein ACLOJK_040558, partial [Asimina triloba]
MISITLVKLLKQHVPPGANLSGRTSQRNLVKDCWESYDDIHGRKLAAAYDKSYPSRRGKLYYLELTKNGGSKISQANQASSEDKARATI